MLKREGAGGRRCARTAVVGADPDDDARAHTDVAGFESLRTTDAVWAAIDEDATLFTQVRCARSLRSSPV